VLLVDVEKGLLPQTRRHALIARLLGIRHAVVFVNKMDRVGYSRGAFAKVESDLHRVNEALRWQSLDIIPGSALQGDMVVERGDALGWYQGPTLLERLETLPASAEEAAAAALRFPVQLVGKPQQAAARGYLGRIESGHVLAGSEIVVLPSGHRSRVRKIVVHGAEREIAIAGDSVMLVLADDLDVARGDLIVDPARPPVEAKFLDVALVWLDAEPLRPNARYLVQHATRRVIGKVSAVTARLDVNTLLEAGPAERVLANDIVHARLVLQSPLFVDPYGKARATGALILIDETSNHTVAAGLVR
jgi:sulfate adenylyltransferase subunit 1